MKSVVCPNRCPKIVVRVHECKWRGFKQRAEVVVRLSPDPAVVKSFKRSHLSVGYWYFIYYWLPSL